MEQDTAYEIGPHVAPAIEAHPKVLSATVAAAQRSLCLRELRELRGA